MRGQAQVSSGIKICGWIVALACGAPIPARATAAQASGMVTTAPRNLFGELLGQDKAAINRKLLAAWDQLFRGDHGEERVYYLVGDKMAYIADVGNNDVRTEGMSYGMMIAVQLDRQEEFDRLWRWTKKYMYHATGPNEGYFAWHCRFDGTQLDPGSASDGEEWFAMALLFAANRWKGGAPNIDYRADAQALLRMMLHKTDHQAPPPTAIFDRARKQVVFAPSAQASTFTDPSYHLPAFYELWAKWADDEADRRFWSEAAETSRQFFHKAAQPETGLMPEYANFDGSPRPGNRGDFRYDAWRTLSNVALDYAWFRRDPWQRDQSNRVLKFLIAKGGVKCPNQYTLEGKPLSGEPSAGLIAMAATAGLAAEPALARPFVAELWEMPIPRGKWRYYNGLLYFLALLEVSGDFQPYPTINYSVGVK